MLKNIVKTALVTVMMFGSLSVASAEDSPVVLAYGLKPVVADSYVKINARYGQYFGQYNPGGKTDTAHFKNFGETGIQFSGGVGNAFFFVEPEIRSGDQSNEFYDVIARASYITPVGVVSMGKVSNYVGQFTTNVT